MNTFTINQKLPSLNEYIKLCRANKYEAAQFKQSLEDSIIYEIKAALRKRTAKKTDKPVIVYIEWHEATFKRDVDNVQSAQKFILDAMKKAKLIPDDRRKYVKQVYHQVVEDSVNKVVVTIKEYTQESEDIVYGFEN